MHLKTEATADGKTVVVGIGVGVESSQLLVSADKFGITPQEELGKESQGKADLIEHRLSRLEQALGLDAICGR